MLNYLIFCELVLTNKLQYHLSSPTRLPLSSFLIVPMNMLTRAKYYTIEHNFSTCPGSLAYIPSGLKVVIRSFYNTKIQLHA